MGVESSISSKVLLRLVISVLTIITLENRVASLGLEDEFCKPAECSEDMNATAPSTNRSCRRDCHDKPELILRPFGEHLVDYDNQSLLLSSEFERKGHACFAPTKPFHEGPPESDTDAGFELPSFLKSNQTPSYLVFLHNFSNFPNVDDPDPYLTCCSVGANRSCVALVSQPEDLHPYLQACASHVLVPVELASGDIEEMKNGEPKKKLTHGIKVKWKLTSWESCVKCKQSGGKCREERDGSFLCFCSGTAYTLNCKGNNHVALKIGVGGGVSALASIFLCLCIYMVHSKQRHPISKFRSRHASSGSSLKADIEVGNVFFEVPIFTNGELEEATNYFDSARELGDGGYGTVYYGKLRDGREVAVKRLYERNCRRVKQFMTEVQILTRLRHKNLVSLYGCTSQHCRELLLVYEYIPNGTVADHLHGKRAQQDPLLWPTRIGIAIETATALAYLHASDIIHRDVKTNNMLLDDNFSVKVADFGLSRLFPNDVSHASTAPLGTPGYVDPEYHQCYQLTKKSDVYSFGVVLVELISSMPAVDTSRDKHEINLASLVTSKIQNHAFHELIDPNLGFESDPEIHRMIMAVAELALRCLHQDKDMRPSMETVLEELKAISSGSQEPDKSKDVTGDNSTSQSMNPPPSLECDGAFRLIRAFDH